MSVQIQPHVKPEKPRKENEFDPTVEALAEFGDNAQEAVLTFPKGDIPKNVRKFREAARHAGYRTREQWRTENEDGSVSVALTIAAPRTVSDVASETDEG